MKGTVAGSVIEINHTPPSLQNCKIIYTEVAFISLTITFK